MMAARRGDDRDDIGHFSDMLFRWRAGRLEERAMMLADFGGTFSRRSFCLHRQPTL